MLRNVYDAYAVSIVPLDTAKISAEHDSTFILLSVLVFLKERRRKREKAFNGTKVSGNSF